MILANEIIFLISDLDFPYDKLKQIPITLGKKEDKALAERSKIIVYAAWSV